MVKLVGLLKPEKTATKKIQKARKVYEIYCKVNSLAKTREATGLAIDTIRRYIVLIENIDNKSKLSTKDRYYNLSSNNKNIENLESVEKNVEDIKNNKNILITHLDEKSNSKSIENNEIENSKDSIEVITTNNVPDLKEVKNKILLGKLDSISSKYLDYLDNPDERKLNKTSLKDRAVIAGILLDKKILLEHKQADVIRNQSIIFNLFGNNKNLASFISGSLARQKALKDRPVKKYILAINK